MLKRRNLLAEGGMMDDSGEVVNGTKVPTGSLANEVADDVPAQLSEGEFVLPADVVRYVGLEKLMKLRDKAKEGLKRMEEIGQVGNADEVADSDQAFADAGIEMEDEEDDDQFESDIDEIINEVGPDQDEQTEMAFAEGGFVDTNYMRGSDLTKAPKNPVVDVRYFKHPDGRMIFITFINDRPMTAIPDGFVEIDGPAEQQVGKDAEDKATTSNVADTGGGDGGDGIGSTGGGDGQTNTDSGRGTTIGSKSLGATGLALMAAGEKLGKVPSIGAKIASKAATYAGQALTDKAINLTTDSFNAMQQAASTPGMVSVSNAQGDVSTMSSPASIAASDAATFGAVGTSAGLADIGNVADTGMGVTAGGTTVSSDATIAAQNEAVFGGSYDSGGGGGDGGFGGSVGGATDSGEGTGGGFGVGSVGASGEGEASDGIGDGDSGGGDGGGDGGGGCFITTAAVDYLNEKDEGETLTTLRKFRDSYMKKDKKLASDVQWYYDNSPKIVEKLNKHKDAEIIYKRIYNQYLRPAVKAIKDGDNEKAYDIYKKVIKYAADRAGVKKESFERQEKKTGLASKR